jgi:hypothetical protein
MTLRVGDSTLVQIRNSELSWERYYAKFVCEGDGESSSYGVDCPLQVEPQQGLLTPRDGGATLKITRLDSSTTAKTSQNNNAWWLIVGTEEETWFFPLLLQ